ncbi:MAG TPA: glutathione S-transferase family protein [Xanthobacteraceae bacterium]|nr:glutathione S-transferase family protein [Xanthobacteraceae bacterium]
MLKLYHYWSSVCSQKARMCLAEKKAAWESHHVDIFRFENYSDWYTRLNPKNVVPTLDHDGRIVIESNVILEYLDEVFPDVPLRPADAYARATMRLWVYNSEEMAHWNVNVCSHNLRHAKRMEARYSKEELLRAADQCSNPMIALRLKRRLQMGVSTEEESEAYEKLEFMLKQMEIRLADGPWLAGRTFSLADVAMAPMINRVEVLARPEMIGPARRPRVADWWRRIQARPGFQEAFAFKNPAPDDPVKR